jgi:hypothetical protein
VQGAQDGPAASMADGGLVGILVGIEELVSGASGQHDPRG